MIKPRPRPIWSESAVQMGRWFHCIGLATVLTLLAGLGLIAFAFCSPDDITRETVRSIVGLLLIAVGSGVIAMVPLHQHAVHRSGRVYIYARPNRTIEPHFQMLGTPLAGLWASRAERRSVLVAIRRLQLAGLQQAITRDPDRAAGIRVRRISNLARPADMRRYGFEPAPAPLLQWLPKYLAGCLFCFATCLLAPFGFGLWRVSPPSVWRTAWTGDLHIYVAELRRELASESVMNMIDGPTIAGLQLGSGSMPDCTGRAAAAGLTGRDGAGLA